MDVRERRAATVAAVREVAPLRFVNGGGTGSLELTAAEQAVTELAAGSGFYAPVLFDHYSRFTLTPAAAFALPAVRRSAPGVVTALGGGYVASGAPGADRLPEPFLPLCLPPDRHEGAGEAQTPLLGEPALRLRIGDRVYMRHAKAGVLCRALQHALIRFSGEQIVPRPRPIRGRRQGLPLIPAALSRPGREPGRCSRWRSGPQDRAAADGLELFLSAGSGRRARRGSTRDARPARLRPPYSPRISSTRRK